MILGIGTDLTQVSRIDSALERSGERFSHRVLNADELARAPQPMTASFLAKRWAAKEAAAKALGTGIGEQANFHDFTITNDALGAPQLTLSGQALKTSNAEGVWHLSLSDDGDFALAFVTWSKA